MRLIPEPGRRAGGLPHRALARRGPGRAGRAGTGGLREQAVRARRSRRTRPTAGRGAATVVIEERLLELIRAALETAAARARDRGRTSGTGAVAHQAEGARRLRDQRRARAGVAGRTQPARGGRGDPRRVPGGAVRRARGGGRPGVPEHLRHRRLAARRAPRRGGGGRVLRRRGAATASGSRWSSSARTRPARCTSVMHATPRSATRSPVCSSSTPAGTWSASTTSTMPAARWTGSAASVEARYLQHARARRRRSPRTGTTAPTSMRLALEILEGAGWLSARGSASRAPSPVDQTGGGGACPCDGSSRTLERFGVRVRRLHVRGLPRGEGRDRPGDRPVTGRGSYLRGGWSGVVPLHDLRRRQGSRGDPLERYPHVLRRGLRVRRRQVLRAGSTT